MSGISSYRFPRRIDRNFNWTWRPYDNGVDQAMKSNANTVYLCLYLLLNYPSVYM